MALFWELEVGGWELTATFRIWRGNREQGGFEDYPTEVSEGMVVLDAIHRIQAEQAGDLAVRWNCKAGKRQLGEETAHWNKIALAIARALEA